MRDTNGNITIVEKKNYEVTKNNAEKVALILNLLQIGQGSDWTENGHRA